jgi:DNA-binding transcriptional regulator YiaG
MKYMVNAEETTIVIDTKKEMTIKEYANFLGVPYQTVATWVQRKQILFRKITELNDLILVQVGTEKK